MGNLVQAHLQFAQAESAFRKSSINRAKIIKKGLRSKNRITAIFFLKYLNQDELKEIFAELVYLAGFDLGSVLAVRESILSLPKEWMMSRIETVVESYLSDNDDETLRRYLELYAKLDTQLMHKLAEKAIKSDNPAIREAGVDFLA
jgi:hypothetical protein